MKDILPCNLLEVHHHLIGLSVHKTLKKVQNQVKNEQKLNCYVKIVRELSFIRFLVEGNFVSGSNARIPHKKQNSYVKD